MFSKVLLREELTDLFRFRLSDLQTLDIQTPCPFKVGMRFEAIDPRHQSTFCVASVAEVRIFVYYIFFISAYSDISPVNPLEKGGCKTLKMQQI